jgi:hypothetical protein
MSAPSAHSRCKGTERPDDRDAEFRRKAPTDWAKRTVITIFGTGGQLR